MMASGDMQEVGTYMKAILFDLDETIIHDDAVGDAAYLAAASLAAPLGADPARLAHDAEAVAERLWAAGPYFEYSNRIGHSATEGLWAGYAYGDHPAIAGLRAWTKPFRTQIWAEALALQGIAAEPALPEAMAARFFAARRHYPLYPEIEGLLAHLKAQGYLLGIVTNGVPDLQREKIAGCSVSPLFDAAIVSGEIDCGKPAPGIFAHICRELGVAPAECVMVGDNPARDVAGAIAARMKSVWVQRNNRIPSDRYPASLSCTDLSAMIPWLTSLSS
ncbi:MAG: putative hydrolase of the superfamily [Symbiobacteriaceae bacterium]|jgi:putative hydrolase of the HAD superfamily|nr:putative hydrolase of the superfamily [Symbiobacteriaceae bacterium]